MQEDDLVQIKIRRSAYAKIELFAKDTGLSKQEAGTRIIETNVDIVTAQNFQQNKNCIFDLYNANIDGTKDFSCMIKRQFAQLRDPAKVNDLLTFCKACPRRQLAKEVFRFEKMLKGKEEIVPKNPQPERVATIKAEIAKDIAALAPTVAAAKKVEPIAARPQWVDKNPKYVKCDNCSFSIYNDNDANKALDDLSVHTMGLHGRDISENEINQLKFLNRLILQDVKKEAI